MAIGKKLTTQQLDAIRAMWKTRATIEIAHALDISRSTVVHAAQRIGLPRRTKEEISHFISETYRKRRRIDLRRIMEGKEQLTRRKVSTISRNKQKKMYNLKSRGYFYGNTDLLCVYYDEQTRRTRWENLYTERYRIRFAPGVRSDFEDNAKN